MAARCWTAAPVLAFLLLAAGCQPAADGPPSRQVSSANGGPPADATWQDSRGRTIPPPPLPPDTGAQLALVGPDQAVAAWVQDEKVVVAHWLADTGWSPAQPLEAIHGAASDPQLASNGRGAALALWRHTVGRIDSLRFGHYDARIGWSVPDVVPGALPRPRPEGLPPGQPAPGAPRLEMDAAGHARARWPSGFASGEVQSARYTPGHGWTRALSAPAAAASAPARP